MSSPANRVHRQRLSLAALAVLAAAIAWLIADGRVPTQQVAAVPVLIALAGLTTWAGLALCRRARRPGRDRDAYEHLQLLRDRTCLSDVRLFAVIGTEWANPAGQAAKTVDVENGHAGYQWFPLVSFPHGSLVLTRQTAQGPHLLDWVPPGEVQAAHRHRTRVAAPQNRRRTARLLPRRGNRRLIAEIEAALRHDAAITLDGPPREEPHARHTKDDLHERGTP